ncbi:MAG: beta-lactamase family protein, partial [Hymenobacteraceae bacterium]|nr:beta-lactamase family protein [Hymenobacteraceae bacterium]
MSPLLQTSIESTLESYYDSLQAGAALLIAEKDTLVFQKELGLADILHNQKITPETNFRMASVSKQFTAMCISLLEQRGLLSYDDNLLHFFPEFCPIGA